MQPPPRKGNYAKFLKNLHTEQIAKLLAKNQHECELLEDIRSFIIKRSAIEKSYSEALLKISSAYLNKKIPNIPDIKIEGGDEKWNMWNVWRTVLEENEKLARARLAAVEVFQQQIADDAKVLRAHKLQISRKCVEQLSLVQKELQLSVQDVDKTKKLYFDEEHCAHDVRDKARDIEEKLKKKKGSFFQSITSLQKNSAKVTSKKEQLEEKSSGARNDYLLCLAAANAHQNRYFVVDLQLAMSTMESNVFDKVAEYLTLMGRTELLTCSAMQNSFTTIRDQAKQLTREYNLQCLYLYFPVLKQHIQYEFEPCDSDPIDHVTAEHDSAAATLSKEARRWATKIARDNNSIRECVRKLQIFNALRESGQKTDPNDPNGPELDVKIEDLKQNIRKAETSKQKAEARIECLRAGGVNVDEWLKEAETLTVQDIQRSASSLSVRTDVGDHPSSDSFYDSDAADGEVPMEKVERDEVEQQIDGETAEVDAMLEQERQRIEQLTAGWDDPTRVDWGNEDAGDDSAPSLQRTPSVTLKCTALYSYTAQNPDELTIVENEQLEVVGEGDGDGWLRARNYKGEEGYVPHNYLDVEREQTPATHGLTNQISFSSVDYTVENEEDMGKQSPEQETVIITHEQQQEQEPIQEETAYPYPPQSLPQQPQKPSASYCCALYDYEGEGDEELTFEEGQVIRVISKCAHSVDDGWWRGELEGRVGNFPSLVVEECDEYGEPLTNQWDETPPCSAPPVFTPPDAPEVVAEGEVAVNGSGEAGEKGLFEMEMSPMQHQLYGAQFADRGIPTIDIVETDEDGKELDDDDITDDFGLEVAQIVITAATPMAEEPDHPFPPPEDTAVNSVSATDEPESDTTPPEQTKTEEDDDDEQPATEDPPERDDRKTAREKHTAHSREKHTAHSRDDPTAQSRDDPTAHSRDDHTAPSREKHTAQSRDDHTAHSRGEHTAQSRDENLPKSPAPEDEFEHAASDSAIHASSSTGSDGETTGPSTAENSVSHAPDEPKLVVGGRASIPDELEPHQLACLQNLKESNA